jgi:hypothetical protein
MFATTPWRLIRSVILVPFGSGWGFRLSEVGAIMGRRLAVLGAEYRPQPPLFPLVFIGGLHDRGGPTGWRRFYGLTAWVCELE